jgi:hypothetical protein
LLSALHELPQFFARKPRFSKQRKQCTFWNFAIVFGHYCAALGRGIVKDVVASGYVIQNKSVPFQEPDQLARFNGG